jgi:hypothetical protein
MYYLKGQTYGQRIWNNRVLYGYDNHIERLQFLPTFNGAAWINSQLSILKDIKQKLKTLFRDWSCLDIAGGLNLK